LVEVTVPSSGRTSHRRFGVICVLGYVALSWAIRFDMRLGDQIASLIYPLDTFSMYGSMPGARESHLLIRDAGGEIHRIEDFRSFDCSEPLSGKEMRCQDRPRINYLYEELIHYIEDHAGSGETEVELIHRTWELHAGARPVQIPDCVVSHCKVSR
jgi:hypothetical protein